MSAALTLGVAAAPAQAQTRAVPTVHADDFARGDAPGATSAPGGEALERARAAWEKGDYDVAEPLYREAVETGGLGPAEVLEAYVHLGATRSVLGKKALALAAFKSAAAIDPHFVVPPEAGKRAAQAADRARQAAPRMGAVSLQADFPSEVAPGESAQVDATLDGAHLGVATRMALSARDPLSGKAYNDVEDSAVSVHFKVPSSLALPGATLVLRVDALDAHQNRLASVDGKTHVRGEVVAAAVTPALGAGFTGTFSGAGVALTRPGTTSGAEDKGRKKGFWATPWPYVIGGAVLAAGGVGIYFATRSSNDVNLEPVRLGTR